MKAFANFLNVLSAIVVTIAVILVFYVCFKSLPSITNDEHIITKKTIIEYKISADENKKYNDLQLKKLDSLMIALTQRHDLIDRKQDLLIQSQTNDNYLNKLFTALIAFIIALAGFFGFKSINEIKAQAIKDSTEAAIETAKITADLEFKNIFDDKYVAKNRELNDKYINDFIGGELNDIRDQISIIQTQILEITRDITEIRNSLGGSDDQHNDGEPNIPINDPDVDVINNNENLADPFGD